MAPRRSPGSRDDPSRATEDRPGSWTPGWRPDSAPVRRSRPLAGTGNGIANRRVADATVGGGPGPCRRSPSGAPGWHAAQRLGRPGVLAAAFGSFVGPGIRRAADAGPLPKASGSDAFAGPAERPAHAFRTLRGRPRDPVPCVPPGQPGGSSRRIARAVRSEFTRIPLSVDPSSGPGRGRGSSTIRRPRGGVPPPHPRRASASARWPDRPHGSRGRPAPPRW